MKMPRVSLGSWAFSFGPFATDPWPFSKVLSYVADAGYDGVEINGFRPHPHPDDYDTPARCAELSKQIEGLGLGVSGYGPDLTHVPPAEVSAADYLAAIRKCLRFCSGCGIGTLRVDTVSPPRALEKAEYESRFAKLAATWNAAAEECRREGIALVWEFEPGFWLNKPSEVKRLHDAVGHDSFGLLFDTSHAYMGAVVAARQTGAKETLPGGVAEYAAYLGERIAHFHVIDSDGTLHDDETSTHAPFGQGRIDFDAVLRAMQKVVEPLEWWCVDYCFCATTETDARDAVGFLREIAARLP